MYQLFVRGVGIAPAEIFFDGAGKQHVLLQHHSHRVPQRFHVVLPHIHAAHLHAAFRCVVKAGDELHQGGLGRAGAADDAYLILFHFKQLL